MAETKKDGPGPPIHITGGPGPFYRFPFVILFFFD